MISLFRKIFNTKPTDLSDLIQHGALIVDVRSSSEFASGHAKNAVNIPLEKIGTAFEQLKQQNHIIVCCRSGNRSEMAMRTLKSKGIKNVTNGGSWQNVNNHIK